MLWKTWPLFITFAGANELFSSKLANPVSKYLRTAPSRINNN